MSRSCSDVCDKVIAVMCHACPNEKECQNVDDRANHDQMLMCMNYALCVKLSKFPKKGEFTPEEHCMPLQDKILKTISEKELGQGAPEETVIKTLILGGENRKEIEDIIAEMYKQGIVYQPSKFHIRRV